MPSVEFQYAVHKGFALPIIPVGIKDHRLWAFADSGATFSIFNAAEAPRIDLDWKKGRLQMVVVGDGSFIPVRFHDLTIQIGDWQVVAPIGFSDRLGVGFNLLGRTGVFDQFQVCFNDRSRRVSFTRL